MNPIKAAVHRTLRHSTAANLSVPVSRSIASTTRNATSLEHMPSGGGQQIYGPQGMYLSHIDSSSTSNTHDGGSLLSRLSRLGGFDEY